MYFANHKFNQFEMQSSATFIISIELYNDHHKLPWELFQTPLETQSTSAATAHCHSTWKPLIYLISKALWSE